MKMKSAVALSLAATLTLTACAGPGPEPANGKSRMANGAIIGGLAGAFLGGTRKEDKAKNAVIAGVIGTAVGAAIGATLDKQAEDLRNSIGNSNISVTNTGEYLIVNMPQDVLFATGSAALRPDLTSDLQAVARNLMDYPDSRIEVIGHTDNTGSAALNQDLSQRRAGSVATVLIGNGVPAGRIATIGRGEDAPVASNLSDAGRAQNRRVEIIIRPTA
ncbi:MAG: OmpA family protein [Cypionkella sp.]|nr:OmpA family protein [Cypionkella sp.]